MTNDKYKNALAHARQAYGSGAYDDATLEAIFPELRESEDERIRKELVAFFRELKNTWQEMYWHDLEVANILAYLERQKEQPTNSEIPKESKPEWSEADEVYLEDALWCVDKAEKSCKDEEDKGACWSARRWLKSLRLQLKLMWSEEDEEMLDAMIDIVSNSLYEPLCPREGMLAWLKSLRPIPHWKPSEEQLVTLLRAEGIVRVHDTKELAADIARLYEQLKAIKEEKK